MGGIQFFGKKRYKGVWFNVISVTRGWVGVQIPGKKRYVTWPQTWCVVYGMYLIEHASVIIDWIIACNCPNNTIQKALMYFIVFVYR